MTPPGTVLFIEKKKIETGKVPFQKTQMINLAAIFAVHNMTYSYSYTACISTLQPWGRIVHPTTLKHTWATLPSQRAPTRIGHQDSSQLCIQGLNKFLRSLFPNNGHFGESASYIICLKNPFLSEKLLTNNYVGRYYIYTAHLTLPETNSSPQKEPIFANFFFRCKLLVFSGG